MTSSTIKKNQSSLIPETPDIVQARLAAIVESSDDAIISKDFNGVITSWNAAAERILGYSREEAIGQHISLIIPKDRLDEEDMIISKIKKGERVEHFETVRQTKNGNLINLSITVSPVRDAQGRVVGASKVGRDITENKLREEQVQEARKKAEAASKAKTEFLATMSHEIRTPLNAIVGIASILSISEPLSPKQKEFVKTLQSSADSLLLLINDLLDISKIEAHTMELEEVPFSINDLVQETMRMMGVRAREKGLGFVVDTRSVEDRVFIGDPVRMRQILNNLCSNAIKFTERGQVSITIDESPTSKPGIVEVIIIVGDTGIGIPAEKLDTVFEKFVQADSSINRKYGGTGLGLSITKQLVEIMGGDISVTSKIDEGSTFTVSLPMRVGKPGDAILNKGLVDLQLDHQSMEDTRKKILLVEDHEPNILVAGTFLENLGYKYRAVRDGAAAIDKIRSENFDAVLMDVQMPGMNGLETTKLIRAYERDQKRPRVPIIGITAHAMAGDRDNCLGAGMDEYISKPFDLSILREKLEMFVQG